MCHTVQRKQASRSVSLSVYLQICGLPFKPLTATLAGCLSIYFKQVSDVVGRKNKVFSALIKQCTESTRQHCDISDEIYFQLCVIKPINYKIFLVHCLFQDKLQIWILIHTEWEKINCKIT